MINLHATGGGAMMKAAAKALTEVENENFRRPLLIAVTVLTSMSQEQLREEIGVPQALDEYAQQLASLSQGAGLDGVVCSAHEAGKIKSKLPNFLTVTPGIRPSWSGSDDQSRITTPKEAMKLGADYIVVGRPITRHSSPEDAARLIVQEIEDESESV
jgi:orotidine-5'-phosphate decarboxylase